MRITYHVLFSVKFQPIQNLYPAVTITSFNNQRSYQRFPHIDTLLLMPSEGLLATEKSFQMPSLMAVVKFVLCCYLFCLLFFEIQPEVISGILSARNSLLTLSKYLRATKQFRMPSILDITSKIVLCYCLLYILSLLVVYLYLFGLVYLNVSRQQASPDYTERARALVADWHERKGTKSVIRPSAFEKKLLFRDYQFLDETFGDNGIYLRMRLVPLADYCCKQLHEKHNKPIINTGRIMLYLRNIRTFNPVHLIWNFLASTFRGLRTPEEKFWIQSGINEVAIRRDIESGKSQLAAYVEARRSGTKSGIAFKDN